MRTALKAIPAVLLLVPSFAWCSDAKQALAAARERYPATAVHAARPTPLPDIYEFDMDGETVYGDSSARYLIFGHLLDMDSVAQPTTRADYAAAAALGFVVQSGTDKELVIFSDPNCPYCAALEHRLSTNELPNYTVRIVLVPLLAGSAATATRILCAPEPGVAYRSYLLQGSPLPAPCDNAAAAEHFALARAAGITATPSLLAPSGALYAGLPGPEDLKAWADAEQDPRIGP